MKLYCWFSFLKSVVKIIEIIFKDRSTKLTLKVTIVRYIHCTECFDLLIVIKVHKHVSLSNGGKNLELRAVKDTKFDLVVYSSCTIYLKLVLKGLWANFFFQIFFWGFSNAWSSKFWWPVVTFQTRYSARLQSTMFLLIYMKRLLDRNYYILYKMRFDIH